MNITRPSEILDKHGRLAGISKHSKVELELGCGAFRRYPEAISIDALDYDAVDIVGDVFDVLARVPDGSVDVVHSSHFVEHVDDLERLVLELGRVLKSDGLVRTVVPHFSNPYFYSDYTHKRPFGLYSFSYLSRDRLFRRTVPRYIDTPFDLVSVRLIFTAPRPFYLAWALGHVAQAVVNASTLGQEWYERRLCYLIPCYEIEYVIKKKG